MISISDCRGCQPQWYYRQTGRRPAPRPAAPPPETPEARGAGEEAPPPRQVPRHGPGFQAPRNFAALLPEGIDAGDLFLAAMLLFLYSESRDEEFLIILAVMALSVFHRAGKDSCDKQGGA